MTDGHQDHPEPSSEIILYQTEEGRNRVETELEKEAKRMARNKLVTFCPRVDGHLSGPLMQTNEQFL